MISSFLNILKYGVVVAIFALAAWQFKNMHEESIAAISNAAKWEADYNQAKQIAESNARALESLKASHDALMTELTDWQNKHTVTESRLASARKKVRALEQDNEEVRAALSTAIPCELWKQIFPDTARCPHQN